MADLGDDLYRISIPAGSGVAGRPTMLGRPSGSISWNPARRARGSCGCCSTSGSPGVSSSPAG
ncbi:hypothetical protein NKG94_12920 [Micromonospora sp. M12]